MVAAGFEIAGGSTPFLSVERWSPALDAAIEETGITHLSLASSWEEEGDGLAFLARYADRLTKLVLPRRVRNPSAVSHLRELQELHIACPTTEIDFGRLPKLKSVSALPPASIEDLYPAEDIQDLALWDYPLVDLIALRGLPKLRALHLQDLHRLGTLVGVEGLDLERLFIHSVRSLTSLSALDGQRNLKELWLMGARRVDIGPIEKLIGLEEVFLENCSPLPSFTSLAGAAHLRTICGSAAGISSIGPLCDLHELRKLVLRETGGLADIERVSEMASLEVLALRNRPPIGSLEWLRPLRRLQWLVIEGARVTSSDLDILLELPSLREARISVPRNCQARLKEINTLLADRRQGGS